MIDPLYALTGFVVGALVGMTGVGGGALMTPVLILFFGVPPVTAVGSDLIYAAITKTGGSLVHGFAHSIDWRVVRLLASGSVPMTVLTLSLLSHAEHSGEATPHLITLVLGATLFVTAVLLVLGEKITKSYRRRVRALDPRHTAIMTVLMGALLGILVPLSSIGAGAIGLTVLVMLYPDIPMARLVGSDIAHAVPLTLIAGIGHWMMGSIDWHIIGLLLIGSLPGIVVGSLFAQRIPERALRLLLAATLFAVASRMAYEHMGAIGSFFAAFTPPSSH